MALIKCPECGTDVSDKAIACPKCAYPLQNSIKESGSTASVVFDHVSNQAINSCFVYDSNGNVLAKCHQGDTVSFQCKAPMTIQVKMTGWFGMPTIDICPGEVCQVTKTGMGKVVINKVNSPIQESFSVSDNSTKTPISISETPTKTIIKKKSGIGFIGVLFAIVLGGLILWYLIAPHTTPVWLQKIGGTIRGIFTGETSFKIYNPK